MTGSGPYYRPMGMGYPPPRRRFLWFPVIIALVFVIAALFLLVVLFYPASFGLAPSSPRYFPFGGVFFLFFILIVGFFIVRVAFWGTRASRYGQRRGQGNQGEYGMNRPAMIARMRYARGEITREQYDQIMQDLSRRPGPPS